MPLRQQVLLEVVVGAYLVEDELHGGVYLRALRVVGLAEEVHAVLPYQALGYRLLLAVAIDGDGVAALLLDDAHAGNVGLPVAHVYHPLEGDGTVLFGHKLVDPLVVAYLRYPLVDLEEELRLRGIIHRHSGPVGDAIDVVEERAGVDFLESLGYRGALNHLLQPRGVDVVLDVYPARLAVSVDEREPLLDALEEFDLRAELAERVALQRDAAGFRLLQHQVHIAQYPAGVVAGGHLDGLPPEGVGVFADRLHKAEFLHVARRERPVEIIDQRHIYLLLGCHRR